MNEHMDRPMIISLAITKALMTVALYMDTNSVPATALFALFASVGTALDWKSYKQGGSHE
jgi:predicted transcriptional regulator